MAKARKDLKGRALWKGECQRASDKRYVYTYTDTYGKRRSVYASDLADLRKKEQELMKDQFDGIDSVKARNITLNHMFERYIATKYDLRPNTFHTYKYLYGHYVGDVLGKKKLADLRYADMVHFYFYLIEEKKLKVRTVEYIHIILHSVFEMAIKDEVIRQNPTQGIMAQVKKKTGYSRETKDPLTVAQQQKFMNFTANDPVHVKYVPLFTFYLGTGCRMGEALGLRWVDVDFENRVIHITHAAKYRPGTDDKAQWTITEPKTRAGIRDIPMIDQVYDALKAEYKAQQERGFPTPTISGMTGFIFVNEEGRLRSPEAINRAIDTITRWCNKEEEQKAQEESREPIIIPHFSCHVFRHTFCTRFCENETNIKVIQEIMGHANISITMDIYAKATEEKKKQALDELSKNLKIF